ncbi:MAG: phosphatidylglycerophosphatase A [Verrucomicrobiales bacterium]|nr:phosphatidylglycerophosphatase A [Verrucomicrobiales bacterium]
MSRDAVVIWLAQGLGSGRASKAPGTWGSLVGMAWAALLMSTGNPWLLWGAALAGVAGAVWVSGEAERILGSHDPGSVVIDEIVAIPLCFAVPWWSRAVGGGSHEGGVGLLGGWPWWLPCLVFVLFRVFDIAKPWPVRQAQRLPGGWGVVADDVLAALWVNAVLLLVVR